MQTLVHSSSMRLQSVLLVPFLILLLPSFHLNWTWTTPSFCKCNHRCIWKRVCHRIHMDRWFLSHTANQGHTCRMLCYLQDPSSRKIQSMGSSSLIFLLP
uniref:Secreted protein n=1 Tax=Opuntia streptacantha TaxID=393608 RepID=A0A7C9DZ90_OPUST